MIPAVIAILLCGGVASGQDPASYTAAVRQYAAGDASSAIALFANSSPRLSGDLLASMRALPDQQVRSAVVMHTELGAARLRNGEESAATVHLANGQRLLILLTGNAQRRAASQTFAIRWYAFIANMWAGQGRFDAAFASVRDGFTAYPGAADLYVARGAVREMGASVVDLNSRYPVVNDRDMSRNRIRAMEAAAADFQSALDADPTLAIARLHRGWIHQRLGDRRAGQELDAALNGATDDTVRYLAHLFRGSAAEGQDDLEKARAEFEAAKSLGAYQTSYVALARIEAALGHAERAREIAVEYALLREKAEDPWWDYRLGGFTAGALDWLRNEARRP